MSFIDAFAEPIRFDALALPTHGPTGARVIAAEVDEKAIYEAYRYDRRLPPERSVPVFDDEGDVVGYRERSDTEYAEAYAAWERFDAEWKRTRGIYRKYLRTEYDLVVTCADGSVAKADGDGVAWRWYDVNTLPTEPTQAGSRSG